MSESNELVAVDNSTAPSTINQFDIVDIEHAAAAQRNFNELVEALLEPSDYQTIGNVPKKKKSAWRKLARAFNISDDIVEKEIIREDDYQIISAWFMVEATLPNGRKGIGIGDCSIFDKIRKYPTDKYPADTETPSHFELRKRFNNAEHDILTTAHTRAKSRAIADLVGGGEVSAEELDGLINRPKGKPTPAKPKIKGQTSTMGMKPKSMQDKAKEGIPIPIQTQNIKKTTPKKKGPSKAPKPQVEDEAIEVEHKVVEDMSGDKPSMSLKEIIDSDKNIRLAVDEIQAQNGTPNRDNIKAKLLDLVEMGQVNSEDYKKAKELLE